MKIRHIGAVATALAGGLALTTGAAAQASTTGYSATVANIGGGSYVNIRTGPSLGASVAYRVNPGTPLTIDCQLPGGRLGSGTYAQNETWDRLSDGRYVHDVVTTTPGGRHIAMPDGGYVAYSSNIPLCTSSGSGTASREARAAQWAQSQLGVVIDSGLCETFAEAAFGTTGRYASAEAAYQALRSQVHTDTSAPAGSIVFYGVGTDGHVGISIGGGQVVSTKSPVNGVAQPVRKHALQVPWATYRGWTYAPVSWSGR